MAERGAWGKVLAARMGGFSPGAALFPQGEQLRVWLRFGGGEEFFDEGFELRNVICGIARSDLMTAIDQDSARVIGLGKRRARQPNVIRTLCYKSHRAGHCHG